MSGQELDLVREAFASNYIAPLGPMVDAFEKEFAERVGLPHCLAVNSGTAAMHLALRVLGVQAGDTVIASSLTFIGSVSPAVFQGATPVFVDADEGSWTMDPGLLAEVVDDCIRAGIRPRAVIPTDLYGQCADYERLTETCLPHGIPVIADAAEAMGAESRGRHAGNGAKMAVFSFNGNKIITTSGGGLLASEDGKLIAHARKLSQQARENYPHYEHAEIGYNYRMSNIVAAIGRGQLRVLDQRVRRKREIFDRYVEALSGLAGVTFMPEAAWGRSNRWLTVILIEPAVASVDREAVRLALEKEDIEARPVWKPMHMQPVFAGCRMYGGSVSERLFRLGLCLPSGTGMTDADQDRVIGAVRRAMEVG
ncbi:MAG: aminotransferase DegT [Lentisphaerae bacterium]|nr:aminotransferase DegT [Lentisphaerota bacterium]